MVRFASLQLRDPTLAEDVVHETFDAALSSNRFEGRSSFKSWVFSILRNKIIDIFRERSRHPTESYSETSTDEIDKQFRENGHWKSETKPRNWGTPEKELENEQFWAVFEICINKLPEKTSQVFMMREYLGFSISEVCIELNLSDSNAWVIMHRARSLLRKCLETYFIQGTPTL